MDKRTEKAILACISAGDHRFRWYAKTWRIKSLHNPEEASKRWWNAVLSCTKRYKSTDLADVWNYLLDNREVENGKWQKQIWYALPYFKSAKRKFGLDKEPPYQYDSAIWYNIVGVL